MARRRKRTVYISGGMSGIKALNFKEFFKKQIALEELGFKVLNPAEKDAEWWSKHTEGRTWEECLVADEKLIEAGVDIIFMMKGWCKSKGARRELRKAMENGVEVWYE